MKKSSFAASSLVLALLVASLAVGAAPLKAASAATSSVCTPQTNPFSVTDAIWGTSSSPVSPYPGEENVPITVTMLFAGPCTSLQASFVLSFGNPSDTVPFTGPNGITQSTTDISLNIAPNTLLTETFYLNVDQGAATGVDYNIPMTIQYR